MSIASPSSEFIYDEYVEGRGVKMTNGKVEMPKQAYLKEHHNLIKLLKETSQKLTREADEQQAELKGKGKGCCSTCELVGGLNFGDVKLELPSMLDYKTRTGKDKTGAPITRTKALSTRNKIKSVDITLNPDITEPRLIGIANEIDDCEEKIQEYQERINELQNDYEKIQEEYDEMKHKYREGLSAERKEEWSRNTEELDDRQLRYMGLVLNILKSRFRQLRGAKTPEEVYRIIIKKYPEYKIRIGDTTYYDYEELYNYINVAEQRLKGHGDIGGGDNTGELHTVVIHKPITVEEAKRLASNFIEAKKHFFRETKHSFRFRNIPKTKFKPKSFRTKVVNKQISLIYGELKTEGAGLKDTLVNVYNRMKRNPFGVGIAEYCGPSTDLSTDRAPTSSTDAICKTHDYDYNAIGQKKKEGASQDELARLTREADNKMLEALKTVKEDKYKDKLIHFIANSGISLKTKLEDMGLLNPTRFSAGKKPTKRATVQYLVGQGLGADIGRFIYDYMLMPYWQFLKHKAKEYIKGKIDSF
jgi:hypothetical protein